MNTNTMVRYIVIVFIRIHLKTLVQLVRLVVIVSKGIGIA